jgi:GNAT superfamily N-acetyltransferase
MFDGNDFHAETLTLERDCDELQALLERCADYFVMAEGEPPSKKTAETEFTTVPPGYSANDLLVIGIRREQRLAGVIELLREFPKAHEWWLSLFVIEPSERSHGLGTRIMTALFDWLREQDIRVLHLAVLEQNPAGERFWRRLGFVETTRQQIRAVTGFESMAIVMKRVIS